MGAKGSKRRKQKIRKPQKSQKGLVNPLLWLTGFFSEIRGSLPSWMRCEGGELLRFIAFSADRSGAVCIGQAVGIDSEAWLTVSAGLTVPAVLCRRDSFRSI